MKFNRTLTATVYIVNKDKVLLHNHKKYNTIFPVGGHIEADELPHEAALREAYEESGLKVNLYNDEKQLDLGRVQQLPRPINLLLENIGHEQENIDFIYFATTDTLNLRPGRGESSEFYWLTKEEIISNEDIKPHIREMALRALEYLS
ncbi:NUDIX hydrolase [Clostridium vincentii]|uniref:NUDIX domain protein n=1 Tax=Clostridium vincentii TaxID=52704 RepID=A0A2T0BL06_9CLOT|nr:NUDIX domain-containing protein [Clostridium vincentii]PRR84561.1 NUDIX domain protein [Clostridium vincentii]